MRMLQKPAFGYPVFLFLVALALAWADPASADGPISNGGSPSGQISFVGDLDSWTFSANTGDTINVQIGESSGTDFEPRISLRDPNGAEVAASNGSASARFSHQASLAGTYTIEVKDVFDDGTGTYTLYLANVPGSFVIPAGDEGGALTNGGMHAGSIDLGDMDMWTFTVDATDTIRVQIGEVNGTDFNPFIALYGPDGDEKISNEGTASTGLTHRALVGGTYTLLVRDGQIDVTGSGDYRLYFANMPGSYTVPAGDEGGVLTNGGMHAGTIDLGDFDVYTFKVAANDTVRAQVAETNGTGLNPLLALYGPDGEEKVSNTGTASTGLSHRAMVGGTYALLVRDGQIDVTGSGDYRLYFANMPGSYTVPAGDEGGVLTNGGMHAGTIDLGDFDVWTFVAETGETIHAQVAEVNGTGLNPRLELYGPDGAVEAANGGNGSTSLNVEVDVGGTYTLVVRDNQLDVVGSGDYQLYFAHAPVAFSVLAGDEGGPLTSGATYPGSIELGDLDQWTFQANALDNCNLTVTETTGTGFSPSVFLYAPNGNLVSSNSGSASASVSGQLPVKGTYTVVVRDNSLDVTGFGDYELDFSLTPTVTPVPAGSILGALQNGGQVSGAFDFDGDVDKFSLAVNAGDRVRIKLDEVVPSGFINPTLQVFGSDNTLLSSDSAGRAAEVVFIAVASDTLTVAASNNNTGTGDYELFAAISGQAFVTPVGDDGGPLVNGDTVNGSYTAADLDMFSLVVNAGDKVRLKLSESEGSGFINSGMQLFGSDGSLLGSVVSGTTAEILLPVEASDTLTLVVYNNNTGAGDYELLTAVAPQGYTTPPGDDGGSLANGLTVSGNFDVADIDMFDLAVNAGDAVRLKLGETTSSGFINPALQVFGSDGMLLGTATSGNISEVFLVAEATDTLTVVVFNNNTGTGSYDLFTAVAPAPFGTPAGDDGGVLSNGVVVSGSWTVADIDLFAFSVVTGSTVQFTLDETTSSGFINPALQVFSSDGSLLASAVSGANTQAEFVAEATDTMVAVVYNNNSGQGDYDLLATGITNLDTDGDGLSDAHEFMIGTLINDTDTDNDGVSDFDEVNYDGDPSGYDPATDLNPFDSDTDGDGIDDAIELLAGTDPLDSGDVPIPGDMNFDGLVNVADQLMMTRFLLGTMGRLPTIAELEVGDLNTIEGLDAGDAVILLQMVLSQ